MFLWFAGAALIAVHQMRQISLSASASDNSTFKVLKRYGRNM